jgi:hypothetical protein
MDDPKTPEELAEDEALAELMEDDSVINEIYTIIDFIDEDE